MACLEYTTCTVRSRGKLLKWILKKQGVRVRTGSWGPAWESLAGPCKHGNESSVPTESGHFLDQLSDYNLLNKDCYMELVA
jgi:hypothetical protein